MVPKIDSHGRKEELSPGSLKRIIIAAPLGMIYVKLSVEYNKVLVAL
jgi:hypothetical protein